jgi:hypothetical protein
MFVNSRNPFLSDNYYRFHNLLSPGDPAALLNAVVRAAHNLSLIYSPRIVFYSALTLMLFEPTIVVHYASTMIQSFGSVVFDFVTGLCAINHDLICATENRRFFSGLTAASILDKERELLITTVDSNQMDLLDLSNLIFEKIGVIPELGSFYDGTIPDNNIPQSVELGGNPCPNEVYRKMSILILVYAVRLSAGRLNVIGF